MLTLSRPRILEAISKMPSKRLQNCSKGSLEFFYLGSPPTSPITPEGSILITINQDLFWDNKENFCWASVGDSGGVRNGFNRFISSDHYRDIRIKYNEFESILNKIGELTDLEQSKLFSKRPSLSFVESCKEFLHPLVLSSLRGSAEQTNWSIEFCLTDKFVIRAEHIESILIPNTYKKIPLVENIKKKIVPKIRFYNPRFSVLQ